MLSGKWERARVSSTWCTDTSSGQRLHASLGPSTGEAENIPRLTHLIWFNTHMSKKNMPTCVGWKAWSYRNSKQSQLSYRAKKDSLSVFRSPISGSYRHQDCLGFDGLIRAHEQRQYITTPTWVPTLFRHRRCNAWKHPRSWDPYGFLFGTPRISLISGELWTRALPSCSARNSFPGPIRGCLYASKLVG